MQSLGQKTMTQLPQQKPIFISPALTYLGNCCGCSLTSLMRVTLAEKTSYQVKRSILIRKQTFIKQLAYSSLFFYLFTSFLYYTIDK